MSVLTEAVIKKAKPGDKTIRMPDGFGLSLEVRTSGKKVFTRAYRYNGKQQVVTLGDFPEIKLDAARQLSAEITRKLSQGTDPRADDKAFRAKEMRREQKAAEKAEAAPVPEERRFETIAARFINKRAQEGIADSTLSKMKWNLGGVASEHFRGRDISDIKPPEVLQLIEEIQAEDKIEKAKDIHRKLSQTFDYAIALGLVTWNPAKMITRAVVKRKGRSFQGVFGPGVTQVMEYPHIRRKLESKAIDKWNQHFKSAVLFAFTSRGPMGPRGGRR